MNAPLRIATFVGSNRRGSINRRLVKLAAAMAEAQFGGAEVDHVDLRRFPLPLYDADLQERDGIPEAAQQLQARFAAADAVLLASPEYNGGYSPLFKNTLDWVSRVDMFTFHPKYVGILAAAPGKGGGARVAEQLEQLLANIFVTTHPEPFLVAKANDILTDDGFVDDADTVRLRQWVQEFVVAADRHRTADD